MWKNRWLPYNTLLSRIRISGWQLMPWSLFWRYAVKNGYWLKTRSSLRTKKLEFMYSSEDLERFYFQYQSEALPHGESLQSFCVKNKLPYNIFRECYRSKSFYYVRDFTDMRCKHSRVLSIIREQNESCWVGKPTHVTL